MSKQTIMVNKADELKKVLKPLEKLMAYQIEYRRTFGPRGRNLTGAYKVMKEQLLVLAPADGKAVEISTAQKNAVGQAVRTIMAVATSEPITQYFRDFCEGYLPLVDNWNRHLGKVRTISVQVAACQRIVSDMITMKDATEIMRGASKRLQQLVQYKPAAFDVSRHYFRSLQDDIEKRKTTGKAVGKEKVGNNNRAGVQQC